MKRTPFPDRAGPLPTRAAPRSRTIRRPTSASGAENDLLAYVLRRLLALIPIGLVITLITFFIMRLVPGDPAVVLLGPQANLDQVEELRQRLGLDQPLPLQYLYWMGGLLTGDLGDSIFLGRSVLQAIAERMEPTLTLALLSVALAATFGVLAGLLSALKQGTLLDQALMLIAMVGLSIPNFWLGFMLVLVFAVNLGWFPAAGYESLSTGVWNSLKYLVLPAVALALQQSAAMARMTRSAVLDVLASDFVRTARAKGLKEGVVVSRHVLRNSLVLIVTVIGLSFSVLVAGAIVVEMVFNIPGLGRLVTQSVLRRDYPVIQGVILLIGMLSLVVNLLIDLSYGLIDPRIRYE